MLETLEVARGSRILIVKLSSIGDVIMATPVAKALRNAFPDSHIAWVVETKARDILQDNPYLDEIIVWDRPLIAAWNPIDWAVMAKSLRKLGRELRARDFDIAIDLQGLLRSALVAKSSGARHILGYDNGREGSRRFYTDRFPTSRTRSRGPQIYLDMLQLLGINSTDLDMHIPVGDDDRAHARDLIARESARCMPDRRCVVALAPATTWPQKHWTVQGWAGLADSLISQYNALPVILGAPVDAELIGEIHGRMKHKAADMVGKTTLKQAAAILEMSDLVVGVDTGLLHMSTALSRPSIGLFGPTGWQHLIRGDNLSVVAKDLPCMPCMRHPTCREFDCMKAIAPEDILAAGSRWLTEEAEVSAAVERPEPESPVVAQPRTFRTLHIETGMHSLGGPAQVVYLMTGLKKLGHEATLVCPRGSSVADHARKAGLDVITVRLPSDLDVTFVPRLFRIIKRLAPEIVHLHSRRGADVLGGVAARLAGAPAVVLSRRIDNPIRRGLLSYFKYGPFCDRIIAVSNGVKDALVSGGVDPDKITCVHSVTEAKRYQKKGREAEVRAEFGLDEDTNVIAIIAQLIERKGHRFLFRAAPRILERFPNTMFLVLGEGQTEGALRELAASLGIQDKVIFAGFRGDIGEMLSVTTVLVHPATMEGFANCVLQAMAAEVPVVVSAVGGMPESVHDGVNGFLVPPQDPDALADAVLKLLADPDLRARMGRDGREIVEEKFCPERMVEGVLSVYQDVLGSKQGRRRAS